MGLWRQIYLDEAAEQLLRAERERTGLSVSELIRRAIHRCYGGERKLSWDEVFARALTPGTANEHPVYEPLFDDAALPTTAE